MAFQQGVPFITDAPFFLGAPSLYNIMAWKTGLQPIRGGLLLGTPECGHWRRFLFRLPDTQHVAVRGSIVRHRSFDTAVNITQTQISAESHLTYNL